MSNKNELYTLIDNINNMPDGDEVTVDVQGVNVTGTVNVLPDGNLVINASNQTVNISGFSVPIDDAQIRINRGNEIFYSNPFDISLDVHSKAFSFENAQVTYNGSTNSMDTSNFPPILPVEKHYDLSNTDVKNLFSLSNPREQARTDAAKSAIESG
jgi:hypothetical protein